MHCSMNTFVTIVEICMLILYLCDKLFVHKLFVKSFTLSVCHKTVGSDVVESQLVLL